MQEVPGEGAGLRQARGPCWQGLQLKERNRRGEPPQGGEQELFGQLRLGE